MKKPRLTVVQESDSGRNVRFRDNVTRETVSRAEVVRRIENGRYAEEYHVRVVNGVKTPASNPDPSEHNNLG